MIGRGRKPPNPIRRIGPRSRSGIHDRRDDYDGGAAMTRVRMIVITAIAVVALAACSGAGGATPSPSAPPTAAPAAAPTVAATAASSGAAHGGGKYGGGGEYATPGPSAAGSGPSAAPGTVQLSGFAFVPGSLTVKTGGTVTFTNADTATHTVTEGQDGTPVANPMSDTHLATGASTKVTFAKAGTYHFTCTIHHSMNVTVTVAP
jgi:plastocyanin